MSETIESTLLVIVGLPGSGKTEYMSSLLDDQKIDKFLDDYEFGPLKRITPRMRNRDKLLIDGLKTGERWAIADTRFCDENERLKLLNALSHELPNININFIYFTNEPDRCQENALKRKGSFPRHEINLIVYYTDIYHIPKDAKILPVYRGS